jgi:hypothetical protein
MDGSLSFVISAIGGSRVGVNKGSLFACHSISTTQRTHPAGKVRWIVCGSTLTNFNVFTCTNITVRVRIKVTACTLSAT